jgi:hypothetical protein
LLNASEGLVARDALPPEVLDVAEQGACRRSRPRLNAQKPLKCLATSLTVELPVELADDLENRFAAHIVRGMSKSKTR